MEEETINHHHHHQLNLNKLIIIIGTFIYFINYIIWRDIHHGFLEINYINESIGNIKNIDFIYSLGVWLSVCLIYIYLYKNEKDRSLSLIYHQSAFHQGLLFFVYGLNFTFEKLDIYFYSGFFFDDLLKTSIVIIINNYMLLLCFVLYLLKLLRRHIYGRYSH